MNACVQLRIDPLPNTRGKRSIHHHHVGEYVALLLEEDVLAADQAVGVFVGTYEKEYRCAVGDTCEVRCCERKGSRIASQLPGGLPEPDGDRDATEPITVEDQARCSCARNCRLQRMRPMTARMMYTTLSNA